MGAYFLEKAKETMSVRGSGAQLEVELGRHWELGQEVQLVHSRPRAIPEASQESDPKTQPKDLPQKWPGSYKKPTSKVPHTPPSSCSEALP